MRTYQCKSRIILLKLSSRENSMKTYFPITVLLVLFLIFNPISINFDNQPNLLNPLNNSKAINLAWAQVLKKPPEVAPVQIPENYVIGQGDVLEVFVWRNEELSRQVTVRPDGKISLPLIQDLQAEGLTVLQLKERITREFKQYVQNPTVTVIISQINSYKINVLGKVASPGVYPITTKTTLLEAISMAGGLTEWAKKRKITVIRSGSDKKKKFRVNYKKIISGKDPSQNIILQRDDTIVVP